MFDKVRIVWNITKHCSYRCDFCAAATGYHSQENTNVKLAILQSILTANRPTLIDFSGGNPWNDAGSIEVMLEASRALGRESISISGLGSSTFRFSDKFLWGIASEYSFTYDNPWWYRDNRKAYNLCNRLALQRLQNLGLHCEVSLTLCPNGEKWYHDMVEELLKMNPSEIHLLQLMPLGRNKQPYVSSEAHANELIQKLRTCGYTNRITKNCAMISRCNGFCDHKLGLDPYGNLYHCIWASDLNLPPSQNPFYLGNLLETPLSHILQNVADLAEHHPRHYCHVLHYLKSHE